MTPSQERIAAWYKTGADLNKYMPPGYYIVSDYTVDQLGFGAVMLSRSYHPAKYPSVVQHEWMIVGKRGRIVKRSK